MTELRKMYKVILSSYADSLDRRAKILVSKMVSYIQTISVSNIIVAREEFKDTFAICSFQNVPMCQKGNYILCFSHHAATTHKSLFLHL